MIHSHHTGSAARTLLWRPRRISRRTLSLGVVALCAAAGVGLPACAQAAATPAYVPGELIVGFEPPLISAAAIIRSSTGTLVHAVNTPLAAPVEQLLRLPRGVSVTAAAARFARLPGIAYAVPDYIAHIDGYPAPADTAPTSLAPPTAATASSTSAPVDASDATTTTATSPSTATSATTTTTATTNTTTTSATTPTTTSATTPTTTSTTSTTSISSPTPAWYPDDSGTAHRRGGWEKLQWNFLAGSGVNAPQAWANLIADHRPGGKGVIVAVLDTGVAYRNWETFRKMPDFTGTRFVDPCDLVAGKIVHGVCTDPYALDREGHGTFMAAEIAEATNNGYGLTGLAYGASIMPVRVLDANGDGDASTIAEGIRYAVQHGASVVNLSLEFTIGVTGAEIPGIIAAINYAHRHNVVVVAAAGNDSSNEIAYPAGAPGVISVGATTIDGCLTDYSNAGSGLDLVAPGGGTDTSALSDPACQPTSNLPDVYQMTFNDPNRPDAFSFPSGWFGTSMSASEVAAGAALVIASHVLGAHPTPDQVLARLEQTATPLGGSAPNSDFGYGMLNIGAATAPIVSTPNRR